MGVKYAWVVSILVVWVGLASIASAGEEGPKVEPAAGPVAEPAVAPVITPAVEPADQAEALKPVIRFESETADLGKVKSGKSADYIFNFRNEGKATLEIYSVQPS